MNLLVSTALAGSFPAHDAPFKSGAHADEDAAVVIGIEDYFVLPDVPHAERDASAVEDLLIYTIGVPSDRVERVAAPASKERIEEALDRAKGLVGAEGTVWVYFAGHGAASPSSGERVLLGADTLADASSFEARSIPIPAVKERLRGAGARTVMMVDACYSGASRGGTELLPGKRFAVPSYAVPDESGWIEWHAAQPDQLSGPLDVAEHGAFTWAMVGALRGWADGQLDDQPDGTVTVEEARLYVRELLRTVEVREQQPALNASDAQAVLHAAEKLEARPDGNILRELLTASPPSETAGPAEAAPAAPAPIQGAPFAPTPSDRAVTCKKKKWKVPPEYPPGSEMWMCRGTSVFVTDTARFSADDGMSLLLADPTLKLKGQGTFDWTVGEDDDVPVEARWVDGRAHAAKGFTYFDDPRTTTTYHCVSYGEFGQPTEWCRDSVAPLVEYRAGVVD